MILTPSTKDIRRALRQGKNVTVALHVLVSFNHEHARPVISVINHSGVLKVVLLKRGAFVLSEHDYVEVSA